MVTITNGLNTINVTRGAFDCFYSNLGYEEVKNEYNAEAEKEVEKTEDELFLEEVEKKPIGQWSKEDVKRFARLNEIDIANTKNVGEAKEIIKQFIG